MFEFSLRTREKKAGVVEEKLMAIKRCTRDQIDSAFFKPSKGSQSSKEFLANWKPTFCFDNEYLGGDIYPSIYGNPESRHDDFKQVFLEVGPCKPSVSTCRFT
jgi:hypothetical protein